MKEDLTGCILFAGCQTNLYAVVGTDFGYGYCENCPANCDTCVNSLICTTCDNLYVVSIDFKSCIL
jgi:hypothetical protein